MAIPGPLHRIPRTSTAKFLGDYCMTNCYRNCVQGKSTEKQLFNTAKQGCLLLSCTTGWWFGTFLFSISYMGCHPSQLTFIFFKMVIAPPTRQFLSYPPYKIYKSSNVATWRLGAGKIIKGWVKQP